MAAALANSSLPRSLAGSLSTRDSAVCTEGNGASVCLFRNAHKVVRSSFFCPSSLSLSATHSRSQHVVKAHRASQRNVAVTCSMAPSSDVPPAAPSSNVAPAEQQRRTDWARMKAVCAKGGVVKGRVVTANTAGVVLRCGALQAFLPLSQLDPTRMRTQMAAVEPSQDDQQQQQPITAAAAASAVAMAPSTPIAAIARSLIGQALTVKVLEVVEARNRLVVSEKQASRQRALERLHEGAMVGGVVASLTDFGAFVDIFFEDGSYAATGLVHISELSWDPVRNIADVATVGQSVVAKVLQVDRSRERVALSLKQVQSDPLLDTLDRLLPTQTDREGSMMTAAAAMQSGSLPPSSDSPAAPPLPGLEVLCDELRQQQGIVSVSLGRQVVERRVVSQDLELWLSNAPAADGQFTLLARAGRLVQEVQVATTLDREQMKTLLRRIS